MIKKPTAKKTKKAKPLTPVYDDRRKSWRLSVPAKLATDEKRQRLYFASEKLANMEADRIRSMASRWGSEGLKVKASLAEDAAKASEALQEAGFTDATLSSVVKEWITARQAEAASITLSDLFNRYRETKIQEGISELYLRDIDRFSSLFVERLGGRLVSAITHIEIRDILSQATTTRQKWNIYRTVRPIFSMAVNDEYTEANPFDRIPTPKHRSSEPEALSVGEVKKLFNACADYRERDDLEPYYKLDASDTKAAFALMVFAGIRPEEIKRLQWEAVHIDEKCIVVSGAVAKTRSHRIVEISDNLLAWLETVPKSERNGTVVPSNWAKKYQLVRKISGIGQRQQDILRHSFASYHLAAHSDFKELQSAMGHGTSEMILKHYKALVRKKEAVKFWSIGPHSTEAKLKSA